MVLRVSFSSRISPFTSTVILRDKITAGYGSRHFGDVCAPWPVRLLAMKFTLSVRSFQVPATPSTCALAAPTYLLLPTSRATRVNLTGKNR